MRLVHQYEAVQYYGPGDLPIKRSKRKARLKPSPKDIALGFGPLALTCAAIVGIIYYSI